MRPNGAYNHPVSNPKHYYGFSHLHYLTKSTYRRARLYDSGAGAERSSAVSVYSGSTQSRASPCASLGRGGSRTALQPYVSAAGQTRVDSPLPRGEGVGQALLPVSKAGAWRASSQAGVPAPLHQPERDG
jgi:hypothetical protein